MAGGDVAAISAAVIQIATAIQGLGDNWYRATADWDDFPHKRAELQRTHDFWKHQFRRSDMLSDPSLMATLRAAEELLEKERAKLERRQATCGSGCWSKVSMTMFPAQVGLRIQRVIDAFDAIPRILQTEEDGEAAVEKRTMRRSWSLPICDDDRYVPLKATEYKVQMALDDPHGARVVLLHGAAGATVMTEEKGRIGNDIAIQQRLLGVLKNQRILITFDDVWEPKFLQEMLNLCGVGVKCLVTSQDKELCRGLTLNLPAIKIQIEDIEENVSMEILASHVGFTNKQIPAHIQGVAQKMIKGTEGNPLALASVARAIDSNRSDELEEWEVASQKFLRMLWSNLTTFTLGMPYSKSFWLATQLSIQSLTKDARSLLILLHMCEATSVPEEVLHIWYDSAIYPGGSETFEMSRAALNNKGLVKISHQAQEYDRQRKQYSWSAHSLQKLFIEHEMSNEKETMLKLLARPSDDKHDEAEMRNTKDFSAEEEKKLWFSLCALYLTQEYIKETPLGTGILPEKLNNLRRNAIEPITRLLAVPVSERWTRSVQSSAKQIYLHYIYNSTLHHGISDLLALPISTLPMLQALQDIVTVESETALLDENSGALMKSLLSFLKNVCSTSDRHIAIAAGAVFVELSRNKLHHGVIISSGILDTITTILSSESDTGLLVVSTNILIELSYHDPRSSAEIAKQPQVLDGLVKLLFDEDNPKVPCGALVALSNLCLDVREFAVMVSNYPRAVEQLVNLLSKTDNPALQIQAINTLGILVPHAQETTQNIFDYPGSFKWLLEFMSKDDSPHLQKSAAYALRHLTSTMPQDVKGKCVGYPGALEKLVSAMDRDDSPKLQEHVVVAIGHLIPLCNGITTLQEVNFPGVLLKLVDLLSKDNSPDVQSGAAFASRCLATGGLEPQQNSFGHPGTLEQLFSSMSRDDNPRLQVQATKAFIGWAASEDDIIVRQLLNFPGLMEQLVNLLPKDDNIELQNAAVRILYHVACCLVDETRLRMMPCAGLLEKFFSSLSDEKYHRETFGYCTFVEALTLIDPEQGNGARLHCALAYGWRGHANLLLGLNMEALEDLNTANEIEPGNVSVLWYIQLPLIHMDRMPAVMTSSALFSN
ncbi:unnamed protein product [Calypogeia fissa]